MRRRPSIGLILVLAGSLLAIPTASTVAGSDADAPTVAWDAPDVFSGAVWSVDHDPSAGWLLGGADAAGAAAWTSDDARTWTRSTVTEHDEDYDQSLRSSVRIDGDLLNVGVASGFGDARFLRGWASTDDGASWSPLPTTEPIYDGYQTRDAASDGDTVVVSEFRFVPHTGRLWTSSDGASWDETTPAMAPARGAEFRDLLASGGRFVAVGSIATDNPSEVISAASWVSTDGVTWTASAPDPALVDHVFMGVAPRPGGGFVAVGHDDAGDGGSGGRPQAWVSADGLDWTEVAGPPSGVGWLGMAIVPIDGGVLAVTSPDAESTHAWTSADGTAWTRVGTFAGRAQDLAASADGAEAVLVTWETEVGQPTTSRVFRGTVGPPSPFTDIANSPFRNDIEWIAARGITRGCTETRFCPTAQVTREQMASFLVRAFGAPSASRDWFADDEGSVHETDINRLATSGVTGGCGDRRFCPRSPVTRAQMASFLARALDLPPPTRDWFADDEGSIHENDINRLREAGVTGGCGPGRFCPSGVVSREQMAAFLHRALTR